MVLEHMETQTFFELCDRDFQYLIEEFHFEKGDTTSLEYLWDVTYGNDTTLVNVEYDRRAQAVSVHIMPTEKAWGQDTKLSFWKNSFYLQEALNALDAGVELTPCGSRGSLTENEVAEALAKSARALKSYVREVLSGDFSVVHRIKTSRG